MLPPMTKTDFERELGRLYERRDASLRKLRRQGMHPHEITKATGFSRRLVNYALQDKPWRVRGQGAQ